MQNFKSFDLLRSAGNAVYALARDIINGFGVLFRTADQGVSWQRLGPSLPGPSMFSAIVASGDTIFLGTAPYGVYVSRDNGATWLPANLGLPQLTSITGLAIRGDSLFVSTFSHKLFVRKLANN